MLEQQRVVATLTAALECSVYLAPTDPGLTVAELLEAGRRLGLQEGEMRDALQQVPTMRGAGTKLLPDGQKILSWILFHKPQNPEYRNFDAFKFVHVEMRNAVKSQGIAAAKLERGVVVERAVQRSIPRRAIEAAVAINILSGHFTEENGLLRYLLGKEKWPLPGEQRRQGGTIPGQPTRNETRAGAYAVVEDIVERRTDRRAASIEPLDAFAEQLERLGYAAFRLWWKQMVAEIRHGDINSTPVSVTVAAAALVEGSLTFVVRHARKLELPILGSKDFEREPHTWKIDDLVKGAAHGGEAAILDQATRQRAEELIRTRQRIHAGRMLSDHPNGVQDLRPDEAREAKAVSDLVVRRVLDWLSRYPA